MKILVEGNKQEIESAKLALESVCMFDDEYCGLKNTCAECEKEQNLKIEYKEVS